MSTVELQSSSSTSEEPKLKKLTPEQRDQMQGVQEAFRGVLFPPTDAAAITLTLQARGERFTMQVQEAAELAGFFSLNDHFAMGAKNHDTDKTLAYISNSMGHRMFGPPSSAQIHIEPEKHLMEYRTAGTTLVDCIQKLADTLDATVLDSTGKPLNSDALQEVGQQVNAGIRKKMDEDLASRKVVMPCGEVRIYSELTFLYDVIGSDGHVARTVYFHADPQLVHEGRATGLAMAAELMAFHKAHKRGFPCFRYVLEEAYEAKKKSPHLSYNKPCVENVVDGFFEGIETLIAVGSKFTNPDWFKGRISKANAHHARGLAKKAEFVERMRLGRAAAKAKRSQPAKGRKAK
ncbi:hypothetical protein HNP33_003077 [Comamonas odontotermitis]|uniref:Uncharacterized protein n=1 Tax=Comamonas odontotermitis TaxID=379895 RepID=A0ABR6RIQ6_9BURK|nr:hypothetical protein [Comamonas odontotermitis]MBB6578972.1 hypothetical protein [Comamonas odontotermitis]